MRERSRFSQKKQDAAVCFLADSFGQAASSLPQLDGGGRGSLRFRTSSLPAKFVPRLSQRNEEANVGGDVKVPRTVTLMIGLGSCWASLSWSMDSCRSSP